MKIRDCLEIIEKDIKLRKLFRREDGFSIGEASKCSDEYHQIILCLEDCGLLITQMEPIGSNEKNIKRWVKRYYPHKKLVGEFE